MSTWDQHPFSKKGPECVGTFDPLIECLVFTISAESRHSLGPATYLSIGSRYHISTRVARGVVFKDNSGGCPERRPSLSGRLASSWTGEISHFLSTGFKSTNGHFGPELPLPPVPILSRRVPFVSVWATPSHSLIENVRRSTLSLPPGIPRAPTFPIKAYDKPSK
jgi:hypothetical protein